MSIIFQSLTAALNINHDDHTRQPLAANTSVGEYLTYSDDPCLDKHVHLLLAAIQQDVCEALDTITYDSNTSAPHPA